MDQVRDYLGAVSAVHRYGFLDQLIRKRFFSRDLETDPDTSSSVAINTSFPTTASAQAHFGMKVCRRESRSHDNEGGCLGAGSNYEIELLAYKQDITPADLSTGEGKHTTVRKHGKYALRG
jgi:hypothetical protein